jgi:hypothetical protein
MGFDIFKYGYLLKPPSNVYTFLYLFIIPPVTKGICELAMQQFTIAHFAVKKLR